MSLEDYYKKQAKSNEDNNSSDTSDIINNIFFITLSIIRVGHNYFVLLIQRITLKHPIHNAKDQSRALQCPGLDASSLGLVILTLGG